MLCCMVSIEILFTFPHLSLRLQPDTETQQLAYLSLSSAQLGEP
jgi:hypothetical protein